MHLIKLLFYFYFLSCVITSLLERFEQKSPYIYKNIQIIWTECFDHYCMSIIIIKFLMHDYLTQNMTIYNFFELNEFNIKNMLN